MNRQSVLWWLALLPALSAAQDASECEGPSAVTLEAAALPAAEAAAHWLNGHQLRWPGTADDGRFALYFSAAGQLEVRAGHTVKNADARVPLHRKMDALPPAFRWLGEAGITLELAPEERLQLPELLRGQLLVVLESRAGVVRDHHALQLPAVLDARFADAAERAALGSTLSATGTGFKLWAPTARRVVLCVAATRRDAAIQRALAMDSVSGIWALHLDTALGGRYYTYLVEVFVPSVGWVRNRVTDPYALSLDANSQQSLIADLDDPQLKPPGWDKAPRPSALSHATDMVLYELHLRDFSVFDSSVRAAWRGKYLAFTEPSSNGMKHLRSLAQAGITDIHLLPVYDFASVDEQGCNATRDSWNAAPGGTPFVASKDCFNWGYDPWHFGAPEGSYATDARDGPKRIIEFRAMVQALHTAGLRVGMDVVYNHTFASGQNPRSVLDRIVPGYYHRLNARGAVEQSTCCENTATEHRMMAKLMIDTAVRWARDYRIDSFRFDLMGHQPRAAMVALQTAVDAAAGRHINLLGEGWNFGEVADGARFEQASQLALNGSGIATFSDRARDAARGGGCCDSGAALRDQQGYLTGLQYAPNRANRGKDHRVALLQNADLMRVGLAGSLRSFELLDYRGERLPLAQINYASQPAGYVLEPSEVVNYVENHDNPTLYDIALLKLPQETSSAQRARVQLLGAAVVAFSQGIAYFHAGMESLRSKSLDRNSYDSGDAINRLDWTFRDNGLGPPPGLRQHAARWLQHLPEKDAATRALTVELVADERLRPSVADIAWTRAAFNDLLRIRASTRLLRLTSAAEIRQRLHFPNTGPDQIATVLVGVLDGAGLAPKDFQRLAYFINVDTQPHTLLLPTERGKKYQLHPVQRSADAADKALTQARYDAASGSFTVPARAAVVFVIE